MSKTNNSDTEDPPETDKKQTQIEITVGVQCFVGRFLVWRFYNIFFSFSIVFLACIFGGWATFRPSSIRYGSFPVILRDFRLLWLFRHFFV